MMHRISILFIIVLIISHRYFQASQDLFRSCLSLSDITTYPPKIIRTVDATTQTTEPSIIFFIWQGNQQRKNIEKEQMHEQALLVTQKKAFIEKVRAHIEDEEEKQEWSDISDTEKDWDTVHHTEALTTPSFYSQDNPWKKVARRATKQANSMVALAAAWLKK